MTDTKRRGSWIGLAGAMMLLASLVVTSPRDAHAQAPAPEGAHLCNDRISVHILPDGRLTFGAFPNPGTCRPRLDGSTRALSGGWPDAPTSFTSVIIGETGIPLHSTPVTRPPTNTNATTNLTEFTLDDVQVVQVVELVANPITGMNDAVRVSWDVINELPGGRKSPSRFLGIRFMVDTQIGNDTEVPLYVGGTEVTAETDDPAPTPEQYLVGDPALPIRGAGILFTGGNTAPDRLVMGPLDRFLAHPVDYTSLGDPMPFDTAAAVYWRKLTESGGIAHFGTTYGMGAATPTPAPDTCTTDARTVCGSNGDDFLTARDGTVIGGPGNDTIEVTVGEETESLTVDCGGGSDTLILRIEDLTKDVDVNLQCGDGNDTVEVPRLPGELKPLIRLGDGNDVLNSVAPDTTPRVAYLQDNTFTGRYRIFAGLGRDRIAAGLGRDLINGEGGADRLGGAGGGDEIEGGGGDDDMQGGDGADVLHGGDGANNFAGGPGNDTCLSDTQEDDFSGCERIRRNHRRNHLPL